MSAIETNSLLQELKNLNNDLKGEHKSIKNNPPSVITNVSTSVSTLSTFTPNTSGVSIATAKKHLTEDELGDFILAKTEEMVMCGLDTIKDLQLTIANTLDAKAMQGYANIIGATTAAMDTLNSINLEKKKQKAQREIKQMEIDAKKSIGPANKTTNNLNIVATRAEILKMLAQGPNDAITIPPEDIIVQSE